MKTNKTIVIIAALAAMSASAGAQDLSTEITVDRIVVPELRSASRMSAMPSLLTLRGITADAPVAEYAGSGSVSSVPGILAPAPWRMSYQRTPYRGYAGVGALPGFNAAAEAGYRFVDTEKTAVGAWLNYDGYDYKHDQAKVKSHIGTLGAYADFAVADAGRLSLDVTGLMGSVSDFANGTRTDGAVQARAAWQGMVSNFSYDVSLGGNYLHMGGDDELGTGYGKPLQQALMQFGVGGGVCHAGESWRWAGLDIDGSILKTKGAGTSMGQYHFTPYVAFHASDVRVRVGAKLSVGSGDDKPSTRVAPSAMLAYAPEHSLFGAELTFTGGESLNPVFDMFVSDHFVSAYNYYGRTNVPVSMAATMHFGRIAGLGVDFHARYASVRNLLLPDGNCTGNYSGWRANTWNVGGDVSYALLTYAIIGVSAEFAGSNNNDGRVSWYEWSDRAKMQLQAYVHATPIDKLDVNIDYTWRHDRRSAAGTLGAMRSLDLVAAYRITEAFTANAELCNLLGCRYKLVSGLPSQALHGLVGISYKF